MTAFELIPAIDLLDGCCVRLSQGRYDEATVFSKDPGAVASGFAAEAIQRLHVVDLDGARLGHPTNRESLRAIVAAVGEVPIQLGGGIRSLAAIDEALALGVGRVILGTVALHEPELVREACRRFPGSIVVGIDSRGGQVAVGGWLETSETSAADLALRYQDAGVAALVYTDISRDGMLSGPNLEATATLSEAVGIPVIASGGIGSEDDVLGVAALSGVAGVIVGRALYTGDVDLRRVLEKLACS